MLKEIERLYAALHTVFGDAVEFRSKDVMDRIAGRSSIDPKCHELKRALQGVFGNRIGPQKLGAWFGRHKDTEAGPYRMTGLSYGAGGWRWWVFKPSSVEEIENEIEQNAIAAADRRDQLLAGKNLNQRLQILEKDMDKLTPKPPKPDGRRIRGEANRIAREKQAEKDRREQERQNAPHVYVAPRTGYFLFEKKAEKVCQNLVELGIKATMGYPTANHFVVHIGEQYDPVVLRNFALKHLLCVFSGTGPVRSKASRDPEKIWNQKLQIWENPPTAALPLGYDPAQKFLDRALQSDNKGSQAIPMLSTSSWNPFQF